MELLLRIWPILFCLLSSVTAQEYRTLDLAKVAFDDQYIGCQEDMEQVLNSNDILSKEKQKNKIFRRAWEGAETIWHTKKKATVLTNLPQGFEDNHGIALVAYSGFIRKHFNDALRLAGKSYQYYMEDFHFKSLHYYLTVAVQLLSGDSCQNLFYEDELGVMFEPSNGSDIVKFGQFLSPFLDDGTSYSNESFTLTSCFGVRIQNFSQYPLENTVVVPGYEVFYLENEGSTFSLNSTGKKCSNYNCAYVRGDKSRLSLDHCISGLSLDRSTPKLPLDRKRDTSGSTGIMSSPGNIYLLIVLCLAAVHFLYTS
ncbi:ecto-ADP-ribosyltransferase 5-like isoform X2 [Pelobates cultripes]|uniref:NAD(P)(+)--arginine ADP-ribosyltransferase n=1 Tax=Pelobates cultripes TaxID=61616 RepID=A0AAD1VPR6_PELCU|nr:ecto-ADP-ribosyltransferase 5-like isoform X2 [Pelobates cultripes]